MHKKPMGTWGRGRGGRRGLPTLPAPHSPPLISGQDKLEELPPLIEMESIGGTRAFVLVGLVSEDGVDNKLVLGPLGLEVECSSGSRWDSELETRVWGMLAWRGWWDPWRRSCLLRVGTASGDWSCGTRDSEGTGSPRSQEEKPGEGEETRRRRSHRSRERSKLQREAKVRCLGEIKEVRTEVSLDSVTQRSLGIFVRRVSGAGERRAMTVCPGMGGKAEGMWGSICVFDHTKRLREIHF